jgi:hypothetical protein
MKIRLTKISKVDNPCYPTPEAQNYVPGEYNGKVSLPIDYQVEGTSMFEPEVGECFIVDRTSRNSEPVRGIMRTSVITKITEDGFETLNSVYKLEKL